MKWGVCCSKTVQKTRKKSVMVDVKGRTGIRKMLNKVNRSFSPRTRGLSRPSIYSMLDPERLYHSSCCIAAMGCLIRMPHPVVDSCREGCETCTSKGRGLGSPLGRQHTSSKAPCRRSVIDIVLCTVLYFHRELNEQRKKDNDC